MGLFDGAVRTTERCHQALSPSAFLVLPSAPQIAKCKRSLFATSLTVCSILLPFDALGGPLMRRIQQRTPTCRNDLCHHLKLSHKPPGTAIASYCAAIYDALAPTTFKPQRRHHRQRVTTTSEMLPDQCTSLMTPKTQRALLVGGRVSQSSAPGCLAHPRNVFSTHPSHHPLCDTLVASTTTTTIVQSTNNAYRRSHSTGCRPAAPAWRRRRASSPSLTRTRAIAFAHRAVVE